MIIYKIGKVRTGRTNDISVAGIHNLPKGRKHAQKCLPIAILVCNLKNGVIAGNGFNILSIYYYSQ